MSVKVNVVILMTWLAAAGLQAQSTIDMPLLRDTVRWMAGMYMDWGIPLQQFDRNMDRDGGLGFGGELLYRIQKEGLVWAGVGVHSYALDRSTLRYSQQIDNNVYTYRDRTTSRIFAAHAMMRFQPEVRFVLRPYVQGAVGMHWYFTNTRIKDTDVDEIVDRINENRDAVLGFAIHGGIQIVPYRLPDVRGDIRIGYYRNASVEYLRYNENIGVPGGFPIEYFERKVSAVDMLGVQIGVTVMLRPAEYE